MGFLQLNHTNIIFVSQDAFRIIFDVSADKIGYFVKWHKCLQEKLCKLTARTPQCNFRIKNGRAVKRARCRVI